MNNTIKSTPLTQLTQLTQLTLEAGEGYRFLDPKTDTKQRGDEFSNDLGKTWQPVNGDTSRFSDNLLYRRKLQPVDPDREARERIAREDGKYGSDCAKKYYREIRSVDVYNEIRDAIHHERRAIAAMYERYSASLRNDGYGDTADFLDALELRLSVDGRAEGEKV